MDEKIFQALVRIGDELQASRADQNAMARELVEAVTHLAEANARIAYVLEQTIGVGKPLKVEVGGHVWTNQ